MAITKLWPATSKKFIDYNQILGLSYGWIIDYMQIKQMIMKIPNLKIKHLSISLVTLLIVLSLVFGVSKGHDYLTVRGLKIDAQRLSQQGGYQKAIDRLSETEGKWTTDKDRNEIKENIKHYLGLVKSKSFFDQARIFYNEGSYSEAVELFKKVLSEDVNYQSAQAWLALTEKKLANGEKKETGGSVAGVTTQPQSDISKDFNQIIPSPAVNANDGPKLEIIKGLFYKIGNLNAKLISYGLILQDSANSYTCDRDKWARQYLPSGEYNPNYAGDPTTINKLYQMCLDGWNSVLSGTTSDMEAIKRQISDYSKQILDVMATCQTNECANFYQEVVKGLEADGYIVR